MPCGHVHARGGREQDVVPIVELERGVILECAVEQRRTGVERVVVIVPVQVHRGRPRAQEPRGVAPRGHGAEKDLGRHGELVLVDREAAINLKERRRLAEDRHRIAEDGLHVSRDDQVRRLIEVLLSCTIPPTTLVADPSNAPTFTMPSASNETDPPKENAFPPDAL